MDNSQTPELTTEQKLIRLLKECNIFELLRSEQQRCLEFCFENNENSPSKSTVEYYGKRIEKYRDLEQSFSKVLGLDN